MIEAEQRLYRAAKNLAKTERHAMRDVDRDAASARAGQCGLVLLHEQADTLAHITDWRDFGIVVGHAGTGKSAMLGEARDIWEAARLRGLRCSPGQ